MEQEFSPIKMLPYLKETLWGGSKLCKFYKKGDREQRNIAESFELSAICGMQSIACDGRFSGMPFSNVYSHFNSGGECPVLIKLIDSSRPLSIQVHPSEKKGEALPKNECWYIIDAEDGATIAYDSKRELFENDIRKGVKDGSIESELSYVNVHAGDFFYVPAGMIHAIGEGITLIEIQQSSDTTYRIYDYGRTDNDGRPRKLHIDEAISAVRHFSSKEIEQLRFSHLSEPDKRDPAMLCCCEWFSVYEVAGKKDCTNATMMKNASITFISDGLIECGKYSRQASPGETFYIPKGNKNNLIITAKKAILAVI